MCPHTTCMQTTYKWHIYFLPEHTQHWHQQKKHPQGEQWGLENSSAFVEMMEHALFKKLIALPETNIAPENWWLEDYFPFGTTYSQGLLLLVSGSVSLIPGNFHRWVFQELTGPPAAFAELRIVGASCFTGYPQLAGDFWTAYRSAGGHQKMAAPLMCRNAYKCGETALNHYIKMFAWWTEDRRAAT